MEGEEDGTVLSIQIITYPYVTTIPTGTFAMDNSYGIINPNTTLPAQLSTTDALAVYAGTWYNEVGPNENGEFSALRGAGAVAGKGKVTITNTSGNEYTVEVEMYDKFDHSITGTITTTLTM